MTLLAAPALRAWEALNRIGVTKARLVSLSGVNRLTPKERRLFETMRADNAASRSPFQPTARWRALGDRILATMRLEGLEHPEQSRINEYLSGIPAGDHRLLRYASWLLYTALRRRDCYGVMERVATNLSADSSATFEFDGRRFSWDVLISLDTLFSIAEADSRILTDPVVVVDLGSGWGRIGYVLTRINPSASYVCADLPEVLLLSSTYLPTLVSDRRVYTYDDTRATARLTRDELLGHGGIRFCGSHHLDRFDDDSVDFFINVASFQEMTRRQIDEYFDVVGRVVNGFLYTQQLWEAPPETWGCVGRFEQYPWRPEWRRVFVRPATFSDSYFEGLFEVR